MSSGNSHPGIFTGLPSFLRACCRTAAEGGALGYDEVGFKFGGHIRDLEPNDLEHEEWLDVIDRELVPALEAGDAAALTWIVARFPTLGRLVPARRQTSFLAGFRRGFFEAD